MEIVNSIYRGVECPPFKYDGMYLLVVESGDVFQSNLAQELSLVLKPLFRRLNFSHNSESEISSSSPGLN